MARFSISIIGYGLPSHPYAPCFEDLAFAVRDALRRLGHEVVPHDGPNPGRLIIFGGQNLFSVNDPRDKGSFLPDDAILFNSEQIAATGKVDGKSLFGAVPTWKKRVVWEYSQANRETLLSMGLQRVVMCPVGYIDTMEKYECVTLGAKTTDVLFYGSMSGNDRRKRLLDALKAAGLKVEYLFRVWNRERDLAIARSKVVLNVHFYEGAVFEIFRVSHLLANRACVVTENGWRDPGLEAFAQVACAYAPYDKLVETCKIYCANEDMRREQANIGYDFFRKIDFVESVKNALEQS